MPVPISQRGAFRVGPKPLSKASGPDLTHATIVIARVLDVLSEAKREHKLLTRRQINVAAGLSPGSGTLSRVFAGISEGSSSGKAKPGAVELGWIKKKELDIDGLKEELYEITSQGEEVLEEWIGLHGGLPPVRGRDVSINKRYNKEENGAVSE